MNDAKQEDPIFAERKSLAAGERSSAFPNWQPVKFVQERETLSAERSGLHEITVTYRWVGSEAKPWQREAWRGRQ